MTSIIQAGDSALVVRFAAERASMRESLIEAERLNASIATFAETIRSAPVPGIRDVVPTLTTVGVYFDPVTIGVEQLTAWLEQELRVPLTPADPRNTAPVHRHRIPVCYGGVFGPDLDEVAAQAGLTSAEVAARHAAGTYRVQMLGFAPGFAYLGPVDSALALPRRVTPHARVAAGSVAIADGCTGIYPSASPGGWHVIGRTFVKPFDLQRDQPFLFRPGDQVAFDPIEPAQFEPVASGR
jgi:inhibitor of KinA